MVDSGRISKSACPTSSSRSFIERPGLDAGESWGLTFHCHNPKANQDREVGSWCRDNPSALVHMDFI